MIPFQIVTGTRRSGAIHAVAVVILSAVMASAASTDRTLTDQTITDAIEDELVVDQAISAHRIDIQTADGIVTLSGTVNNLLAKTRATRIAETVKGVRSVVNKIQVEPTKNRTDKTLQQDVSAALKEEPSDLFSNVNVQVNEGTVILSGRVKSWYEKHLAEKNAEGVAGVTAVTNNIDVHYEAERSDAEIKETIEQKLRWNALIDHAMIGVDVQDANVTLTGMVGSAAEKRKAILEAWVAGAKEVDSSGLAVEKWARDEALRKDKYAAQSEQAIQQAIEAALRQDPRVDADAITVESDEGMVTLRGKVNSLKAKRVAAQDARNTVGVSRVKNRLKVRMEQTPNDATIAERIQAALKRDPYLEPKAIDVSVLSGAALLTGVVDTYFEKAQADDVVSGVQGVAAVYNNLSVSDSHLPLTFNPYVDEWNVYNYPWYGEYRPGFPQKSDQEIKSDIETQLWWSPYVEVDEVKISVERAVATLSGAVNSWAEWYAAQENAFEGGATGVVNQLKIK
jgi:osmotically-inducible protein OsmY